MRRPMADLIDLRRVLRRRLLAVNKFKTHSPDIRREDLWLSDIIMELDKAASRVRYEPTREPRLLRERRDVEAELGRVLGLQRVSVPRCRIGSVRFKHVGHGSMAPAVGVGRYPSALPEVHKLTGRPLGHGGRAPVADVASHPSALSGAGPRERFSVFPLHFFKWPSALRPSPKTPGRS